jgi:hypothetical protein
MALLKTGLDGRELALELNQYDRQPLAQTKLVQHVIQLALRLI